MPETPRQEIDVDLWMQWARQAREGRDRWREVGVVLLSLREAKVPWKAITAQTGISRATGHRMIGRFRVSGTTDSGTS